MPASTRAVPRRSRPSPRRTGRRVQGSEPPASTPWRGLWWRLAAIVIAGALTYSSTIGRPFIFDDLDTVVQNAQIRDLGNVGAMFASRPGSPLAGHPLANVSLAVNYALGGLGVGGYHALDIALHLACALLLFGLIRRTLEWPAIDARLAPRSTDIALAASLLWVVHPLNSVVVNSVTERPMALMALCYLGVMYACARAPQSRRPALWQIGAVVVSACGMASDPAMVTAPLMVVLYDRAFLFDSPRAAIRSRWRLYAGLAATWLVLLTIPAFAAQTTAGGFEMPHISPWTYLLNQAVILPHYLWLTIWPRGLVLDYGWARQVAFATVWPYAACLAVGAAAAVLLAVRRPRFGFPAAWILLTLVPSSTLIPWPAHVGAESRMYLPLAGFIVLLVVVLVLAWVRITGDGRADLTRPTTPLWTAIAACALLAAAGALATRTVLRGREYASVPDDGARDGRALAERDRREHAGHRAPRREAGGRGNRAFESRCARLPPAVLNLCLELIAQHEADQAIPLLQQLIRQQSPGPWLRDARITMAQAFEATQAWSRAADEYQTILNTAPDDAVVHGLLATALARQGTLAAAVPHYQRYLAAHPDDDGAWTGLGIALVGTGNGSDAVAAFGHAEEIVPQNPAYRRNLGRALLSTGDVEQAGAQAQEAETIAPNDAAAHELMGEVLATAGRFDGARQEFQRALEIDPANALARSGLQRLPPAAPAR